MVHFGFGIIFTSTVAVCKQSDSGILVFPQYVSVCFNDFLFNCIENSWSQVAAKFPPLTCHQSIAMFTGALEFSAE